MKDRVLQVLDHDHDDGLVVRGVVERADIEVPWTARHEDGRWRVKFDMSELGVDADDLVDIVMEQGPLDPDIDRELARLGITAG